MDVQSLTQHDVYSLSDHMCLQFILPHGTVSAKPIDYVSRDWSAFDPDLFEEELANKDLADMHTDDVDSILCEYDGCLSHLLDKHAPPCTVRWKPRRNAVWFDRECSIAKRKMQWLEDVYRRTRSIENRNEWQTAMSDYRGLLRMKEQQYWNKHIAETAQN